MFKGSFFITDPGKTITDFGKAITDLGKTITDPGKTITDLGKTITDLGKTITDPEKTITERSVITNFELSTDNLYIFVINFHSVIRDFLFFINGFIFINKLLEDLCQWDSTLMKALIYHIRYEIINVLLTFHFVSFWIEQYTPTELSDIYGYDIFSTNRAFLWNWKVISESRITRIKGFHGLKQIPINSIIKIS